MVLDVDGVPAVFAGGGDVGRDLAAVDWAATPLGPPQQWPQSLVSVVRVVLSSRFAMWMAWGPELTFLCNDAYRRDTLASKYPWALGRPASEVWAEIWPDIGPRIDGVLATGEATWDEGLLLLLERRGYREETYHTFSYSPLTDDAGQRVGMLCVVSEDTGRVIGAQRLAALRDVGAAVTALRSERDVLDAAEAALARHPRALPYARVHLLDGDAPPPDVPAEVCEGQTAVVDLRGRTDLPTGAWDEPPVQALVVPFAAQDEERPQGCLVVGLNPYVALDDDHAAFVGLLASQVGAALASARAYEAERDRAERLQELDRAKTEFFTNVSHEFRTPLTLLLGPASDALEDTAHPLDPVQRERVEIVARNGERLLKLVNTLLDFSRLEAGTLDAQYEPVDLAAYTAELAGAFSAAVERVGLRLDVDCPPLPEPVLVDREMWAKVVFNLLSNALKFTFEGGIAVRLDAAEVEGRPSARLVVTDTGTGIPLDQQESLFARFTRVSGAASRSHEGSGIGLALVADLAAAHGGTVAVTSAPGEGSAFTVTVPLGREHLPAEHVVAPVESAPVVPRSARGFLAEAMRWLVGHTSPQPAGERDAARPTVLVVDDNADMRDYVTRLLAPDHDVLVAADGQEGLEQARAHGPDLVLSDVMMPRLDGFGLLAALRADPLLAPTPVVLLSARAGEESTVEGLEAGADDYLAKPFSGRELLARVRANLELERVRRHRRDLERSQEMLDQAQRLARVGSWELDLATGALTGSEELKRQLQVTDDEMSGPGGLGRVLQSRVHPDDRERVGALVTSATGPLEYEHRIVTPDGQVRTYRALGEVEHDEDGTPVRVRGSNQDVTDQHAAARAVAEAAVASEAAAREHRIADELQRSLLPDTDVTTEALRVASYYRAGVAGTQVGGDWYDVVELGAGRTALVLGDVMGRGVRAAAVMGQLRAAVRAYAHLDLPPADVLEHLDGVVRDLGEDQIVTCVYAVYDPYERVLTWANAGHLPPLVRAADGVVTRLVDADGPPLGTSVGALVERRVELAPGSVLALYTDGLVERRDGDIDSGVDALARLLGALPPRIESGTPDLLVDGLLPDGPDDDVAVLLVQVEEGEAAPTAALDLVDDLADVGRVRRDARRVLAGWDVGDDLGDDVLLLLSELATNALVHGHQPVQVRLRRSARNLVLEVHDSATFLPRRMRPSDDDEHGRGLQLVSLLAQRWGTRPTPRGKAVWCLFDLPLPG